MFHQMSHQMSQTMRVMFVFLLFGCMQGINLYANEKLEQEFTVSLTSFERDLLTHQLQAELKMSQNTEYCRGTKIPMTKANWDCKHLENKIVECVIVYECKMITRERSRMSESRRIREELKKVPKEFSKSKITVSKNKVGNLDRKTIEKITAHQKIGRPSGVVINKDELEQIRKGATVILPDPPPELLPKLSQSGVRAREQAGVKTQNPTESQPEGQKTMTKIRKIKERPIVIDTSENDGDDLLSLLDPKEDSVDKEAPIIDEKNTLSFFSLERLELKKMRGSFLYVKDNIDADKLTIGASWTPLYKINDRLKLRGHVGLHLYSMEVQEENNIEEKSFMVFELGGFVQYYFDKFFVEGGVALHRWQIAEIGGTYSVLGIGGGYLFTQPILDYIDRWSLNISKVANDAKNLEIRFGMGLSF